MNDTVPTCPKCGKPADDIMGDVCGHEIHAPHVQAERARLAKLTTTYTAMHLIDMGQVLVLAADESNPGVPVPDRALGETGLCQYDVPASASVAEVLAANGWTMLTLWEIVSNTAEVCDVTRR